MKILKYKDENGVMQPLYEIYKDPYKDYNFNGYDFVDMGDAGIWATCNVGANSPEESGLYFAWGETEGYPDVSSGKEFSWEDYKFGTRDNYTKYNGADNLTTLELEDDAAHVNMGGDWRMPTQDEFQKFIDLCNYEYITDYKNTGIKGGLFTLKTDESKQLFFPATGAYGYKQSTNMDYVVVHSSSLCLYFIKSGYYMYGDDNNTFSEAVKLERYYGKNIRGFIPKS